MDLLQGVLLVCSFFALISCTPSDTKTIDKRSADAAHPEVDVAAFDDDGDDLSKRVFRYGKRAVFRYGKRPSLLRYGKRALDDYEDELLNEEDKRVFRYGKRDMDEDKRVFRYGKRDIDEDKRVFRYGKRDIDEAKRVFRFGKRDDGEAKRRVFRYGKRSSLDDVDDDLFEEMKRKVFRFGKRFDDSNNREKVLLDFARQSRANEPHVPFRFGDEE